ncbi:MAG: hypothetical protein ACI9VR_003343 [Cognaticolwellia sp.]|jgi:hypothetical protein
MASSERASAALALSLTAAQSAQVLQDFSVQRGAVHFMDKPLKSSWRLSGVLMLTRDWPGLAQIESLAMRAEPGWAPDFGILAAMTSLTELRLSLSRHPIPGLPTGLRTLRLDLPGDLDLAHPALERLHIYGAAPLDLPDWTLLPLLERLTLERMDSVAIDRLPARLVHLDLLEMPDLMVIPDLGSGVHLRTLRCPKLP